MIRFFCEKTYYFWFMKKFEVPSYFRSSLISEIKAKRKAADPMKKDFSPTLLELGNTSFIISRHFGFCYGVENAIEKSYKAIHENPDKRIFLLSQMIHNPDVNKDLEEQGIRFLQDTEGNQLIDWNEIVSDDIVIIPAFGATIEMENFLNEKGIDLIKYNTTCPFVEKVWKRAAKLGDDDFTVIIHGKAKHEETRATFSHARSNAPSVIVRDLDEAKKLAKYLNGVGNKDSFYNEFGERISKGFNPDEHLKRVGVVNQTTMLATETQEIAEYFKSEMIRIFGDDQFKSHFADTRDTLCYATNDNQSSTLALLEEEADIAFVVGGYNSSNTSHLVEILERKFDVYFIRNADEIISNNVVRCFDIHEKNILDKRIDLATESLKIIITSGASCPDSVVEEVIEKINQLRK